MPKSFRSAAFFVLTLFALAATPLAVLAQTPEPALTPTATQTETPSLQFFTPYPSQVFGIGETISVDLTLQVTGVAQTIALSMKDVPAGWTAAFEGNSRQIQSVYLEVDKQNTIQLRLTPPSDLKAGSYNFTAAAAGTTLSATVPIVIIIQQKVPPKLTLTADLPTLTGPSTATFTYNLTLANGGADDLVVNLNADSKGQFQTVYQLAGQTVTSLPVAAGSSKSLTFQATALSALQAGDYPISLLVSSGSVQATLDLTATVTGQVSLTITTPNGTLSGDINSGSNNALKLDVKNTGSSTATSVALSATSPTGWTVTFDPATIPSLPPNQQVEVTLNTQPSDQSVAGDYMLTLTAQPTGAAATNVDFRVTLLTSTLWGIVGVVLIAIAVLVVALAVMRFGRR
jgi:uncharacterized membrane protein